MLLTRVVVCVIYNGKCTVHQESRREEGAIHSQYREIISNVNQLMKREAENGLKQMQKSA